ncbi:hypothetical protein LX36DRAFT_454468 [Colletotrichum falcatum]|nr:hypothetical protein LX36DRAFT_454468 [Colletotrichum falcatum]
MQLGRACGTSHKRDHPRSFVDRRRASSVVAKDQRRRGEVTMFGTLDVSPPQLPRRPLCPRLMEGRGEERRGEEGGSNRLLVRGMVLMVQYTVLAKPTHLCCRASTNPMVCIPSSAAKSVRNSGHRATANPLHPEPHRIQSHRVAGVGRLVC